MPQRNSKNIGLYVVEGQDAYLEVHRSAFPSTEPPIDLLGISEECDWEEIREAVVSMNVDVLLVGGKGLKAEQVTALEQVRMARPQMGIVLLLVVCNADQVKRLRRLALSGEGGLAIFMKQSIDQKAQLCSMVAAVSQGQLILEQTLANFLFSDKADSIFLGQLTSRELETLNLLAKGYRNSAIAEALYIDIKTVQHHVTNIYSKLKVAINFDKRHDRVSVARLYLEAIGELAPPTIIGGGNSEVVAFSSSVWGK
ncbi:response regulator transcription factor [Chloroflexota bacterium]